MSETTSLAQYDEEVLVDLYRTMRRIRRFEETVEEVQEDVPGGPHLYIGQEAVAAGACRALRDEDVVASTHRGHGHVLARGTDPGEMLAELGGTVAGTNGGRGGTMHLVDFSLNVYGCNGILGASAPHAVGAVLAGRLDGDDGVGMAFFGDGAANEGIVPETLNLAAIWDLPVVFVCENNHFADTTSVEYAVAGESIAERAEGYGVAAEIVDGQDVLAVYDAAREAVERAREAESPRFLECDTRLYREHSAGVEGVLDRRYHTREYERWKQRDPIESLADRLAEADVLPPEKREAIDADVDAEMEDAVALLRESDPPDPERVLVDAYANDDYPALPAPRYR